MPLWATITQWPPDNDVVPDLHQIINFGSQADGSILKRSSVDGRIGADLRIIRDQEAANLRNLKVALATHRKAEAVPANTHTGVPDYPIPEKGMIHCRLRANVTVAPDHHPAAEDGAGGRNAHPFSNTHLRPTNNGACFNRDSCLRLERGIVGQSLLLQPFATH